MPPNDMRDRFSRFLERRTAEITAYRFARHNQIIEERRELWTMALELKGLKGKAIKLGTVFDRLNRAYDKVIETGDAHAGDVESLEPQLGAMQDDISFAVTTLGNSVNGSNAGATGEVKEKAGEKQVVTTAEVGKIDPEPIVGQQGAITAEKIAIFAEAAKKYDETMVQVNKSTDHDINRVALGPHPDQPEVAETASQTFPQGS